MLIRQSRLPAANIVPSGEHLITEIPCSLDFINDLSSYGIDLIIERSLVFKTKIYKIKYKIIIFKNIQLISIIFIICFIFN